VILFAALAGHVRVYRRLFVEAAEDVAAAVPSSTVSA